MPKSPLKPTFANAVVNFALSAASRRSHASAMPSPAPAQAPLTAATVGLVLACSRPESRWIERCRSTFRSTVQSAVAEVSPIAVTSPPAQKPRPAPVTTMHPTAASSAQRSSVAIAASSIGRESAFSRSGRFRVRTATPSRISTIRSDSSSPEFAIVVSWNEVAQLSHDPRRSTSGLRGIPEGRLLGRERSRGRHASAWLPTGFKGCRISAERDPRLLTNSYRSIPSDSFLPWWMLGWSIELRTRCLSMPRLGRLAAARRRPRWPAAAHSHPAKH